jgi:hypothetical protein
MLRDPYLDWMLARERRAELERAAHWERLIALANADRPRLIDRWLLNLGYFLIEIGLKLREAALEAQGGIETTT